MYEEYFPVCTKGGSTLDKTEEGESEKGNRGWVLLKVSHTKVQNKAAIPNDNYLKYICSSLFQVNCEEHVSN